MQNTQQYFFPQLFEKKTYQTIPMADHHFPHGHVLVVNPPFLGPEKQLSQRALGKGVLQGNSQL
jgi:hypothetical protein